MKASTFGGEVTNESDVPWLISGGSNSNHADFFWLPPNTNSDDLPGIDAINADVDAVWPAGKEIRALDWDQGKKVSSGAFKLRDYRNVLITGNKANGYVIWNYSVYFKSDSLPYGWSLPPEPLLPKRPIGKKIHPVKP